MIAAANFDISVFLNLHFLLFVRASSSSAYFEKEKNFLCDILAISAKFFFASFIFIRFCFCIDSKLLNLCFSYTMPNFLA